MIVHKLTTTQKGELVGKQYTTDMFFNPTQDADGFWFISVEEVEQCDKAEFAWVKDLPTINHNPVITQLP
jgi:hypothetical protein